MSEREQVTRGEKEEVRIVLLPSGRQSLSTAIQKAFETIRQAESSAIAGAEVGEGAAVDTLYQSDPGRGSVHVVLVDPNLSDLDKDDLGLNQDQEAALRAAFDQIDASMESISSRLDRMHDLTQDMITDIRAARESGSDERLAA